MRGTFLGIAALAVVLSALALAPSPAGACSIVCVNQRWGLTLAEVEIVDDGGDTDATLPDWPEDAVLTSTTLAVEFAEGSEWLDYAEGSR